MLNLIDLGVTSDTTIALANIALIPLMPLIGSILAFLCGVFNRKNLSGIVATLAAFLSFILSLNLFYDIYNGGEGIFRQNLFTWFALSDYNFSFSFQFDRLSAVMVLIVTGVGSLIHLYSIGYMHNDKSYHRFFSYLNLFLFSMLLLVLGGNLLILFIGWEGVGLCSYLLIGFWFENYDYAKAGRKAFVVNRIGDAGFLIAIFLLIQNYGTLDFIALQNILTSSDSYLLELIGICLFIGATGKSAQIPLYVWLPDAMAGPTPVSALIHAATMVTAGVYLMARLSFLYLSSPITLSIVILIAVFTAFVAATIAIVQNDIKKVLAYSTVSQLGFMFMAAGAGVYWAAIFHLVTHAFFKACLFLSAGSVIHGCHHEQDMRKMGGLARYMPWTFACYGISTLAIAGIYPFSGYFSKHAILNALGVMRDSGHILHNIAYIIIPLVSFTAFLTAFYMTRSLALTFFGKYRGDHHPEESPLVMVFPLIVLALLAIVAGVAVSGGEALASFLDPVVYNVHLSIDDGYHSIGIVEGIAGSWLGILGVILALFIYTKKTSIAKNTANTFTAIYNFLLNKYYVDQLYSIIIVKPLKRFSQFLWQAFDIAVVDGVVNGSAKTVDMLGQVLRVFQTGQIRHYLLFAFLTSLFLIMFYIGV